MSRYEDGLKLIEERCGNGKDNVISLATIAMEPNADGKPRPYVRDVDAYYEDGVFYVTTWAKSTKMRQIAQNQEVSFTVCSEWFSGNGIGENIGWVLDPKNGELRTKLRTAFAEWYDLANNEKDVNCCILAIRITRATVIKEHGAVRYNMDFVNKTETEEGTIT
ncbi:MAG: pyridoxamine 5'-phosphate oxidase family protein [Treponema sp.]|nr:pyridoxamine 5'-phosphate oxidase family protein [Treponema sp.]